ncbi:hypothetical protein BS47DRAFT_1294709, partial [Hydnum rufescens UP504]
SKSDLTKQLQELKTELLSLSLCVQKIASPSASKLSQISTIHKSITHVLTVTNQKACQNLQEYYKNKKYLPLDGPACKENLVGYPLLAIPLSMPNAPNSFFWHQDSGKMEKQHKQDIHFPTRKYTLKA